MLNESLHTGIITCIQDRDSCYCHLKIKASGNNGINGNNIGKHLNKIKNRNKNNVKGIRYERHHN